ncbi:MAG: ParB/RepB/Spo0J family partition protein [Clostridium sp.]|nr:ParB/RepB/Spo0J family partition protein [Clostridium sp.]
MSKRRGLGRGLESFFGDIEEKKAEQREEKVNSGEKTEAKEIKSEKKNEKKSAPAVKKANTEPKRKKTAASKKKNESSSAQKTAKKTESGRTEPKNIEPVLTDPEIPVSKKEKTSERTAEPQKNFIGLTEEGMAQKVSLALIDANSEQPRKKFNEEELAELAASIRTYGVLQPLIVTKKNERYEIIAGERRYRASKLAGLREVPVIVRDYSRQEMMEVSLIENIQRSDLNAIEEAKAYHTLITDFGLTQEEISTRVSKSRVAVTNSMRLLKLDEKVQNMLVDGKLTAGHARALLGLTDREQQAAVAEKIAAKELSVRETEQLVKKLTQPEPDTKKEPAEKENDKLGIFYRELEDRLKEAMGTKVQIRRKEQGRGRIEIEYYSADELERISEMLQSLRD